MSYKSYKTEILVAMKLCKHEYAESIGNLVVAESQNLVPVLTGNLRRSIVSEVMENDEGVYVGVTQDAPYGLYVEKGTSKQNAQPFLEPGAINSIPHFIDVARKHYNHMNEGN
jgi:HK97 gp10 family phage protein